MTGARDEFTPYWLQTAVPFGMASEPPWLRVPIPRPTPDYLDGSSYWGSRAASQARPSPPNEDTRGLLYSYSQPDEPWSGQSPPSIWESSPWDMTAQAPWRSLAFYPLPNDPWPTPQQSRSRFDSEDAAKSFKTGLAQGALGLAGTFGNAREQIASSAQQLTDNFAPGYGPTVRNFVSHGLRSLPYMKGPSSSEIQERIEPLTGPFYQPQTVAGDYLRTLGEFTSGLAAPGGISRNAARNVVVPALASETAGQWTKGTWYEPFARALAAFLASAGHLPGSGRLGATSEQLPRSGTADPTLRSANPSTPPEVLYGKETSGMLVPPRMPPRPLSTDYPSGAPTDASGRLLADIEGRPLHAQYIAGRRVAGGRDVGLTPSEAWDLVTRATGMAPREVPLPEGVSGSYTQQGHQAGKWVPPEIEINRELTSQDKALALAHEVGHMAHDLATEMSLQSLRKLEAELTRVYDLVNKPMPRLPRPTTPQYLGYSDREAPFELIAEGMRSYMIDPNFFKSVAPNAAALFRAWVNSHPQLSKLIQLNGLGGLAVLGAGTDEETDEKPHT